VVTLGTGIGGAIVTDGRVQRGAAGFAAEIGHFTVDRSGPMCACGERGHWEAIASGTALGRLAAQAAASGTAPAVRAAAGDEPVDGHHLVAAARSGDAAAIALLDQFAADVAIGLAGLANILDPAVIVVAGGLVEIGDLLFTPLRTHFVAHLEGAGHRPEIPVLPAMLGERAGAIGAALQARDVVGPG
jgi:glucokinase